MGAFIPLIATAAGSVIQGQSQKNAGEYNAAVQKNEGISAEQQSLTAEATQRRAGREFLGRQAAAVGQAGIGYGGSAEGVMDQSAINAELDALNVRYRGQFTKYGYDTQSKNTAYEGRVAAQNSNLSAGATLLKGTSKQYTGASSG